MASSTSTSSTRYLRGRKRVLHKDDIPLDNNIFNENNSNNSQGLDVSTYNTPADGESPKIQSNENQNYNNKSTWDLGNLSPSILFAEAAVVTLIVGTILICCLQRHKRRLLNQQREQLRAMQEWATIRIPSTNHHQGPIGGNGTVATQQEYMDESRRSIISSILDVSNGQVSNNNASPSRRGRVRMDSNISGILSRMNAEGTVDIDGRRRRMDSGISGIISLEESIGRNSRRRGRVDSGISGMYSVRSSSVGQQQQQQQAPVTNAEQEEVNQTPLSRTLRTLSLIPRALGNILLYPLRSLEAGVNNWATNDYDREFLRQFMEQVELEREAALEPGDERELRLKEAFSKGGMVWELDDEHFLPPKDDLLDNNLGGEKLDDIEEGNVYDADDQEEVGGTSAGLDNLGLISLGVQANHLGEKSKGDIGNQENEADVVRDEVSAVMELLLQDIQDNHCNGEEETDVDTSLMAEDDYTMGGAISINAAMIPERPSSSPPQLMGGGSSSSSTLSSLFPSVASSSAIDIIEESPSFLYLSPGRRRVNTSGSLDTSANNQTASSETIDEIKDLIKESDISSEKAVELIAQYEGREETLLKNLRRMPPLMGRPRSSSMGSALSSQASAHNKVPNECAICLSGYEKGETIVTSYNGECPHAFHQECIVEWLVKMQDGAPCPCCRRTFIDLDALAPPRSGGTSSRGGNNNTNNNANNNVQQDPEEAERQRLERRRRRIEQGIQRGGRTFNTGIISLR